MSHILVIDNDRSVGAAIQLMLEYGGHSSIFTPDTQSAIDALAQSRFDLAFVDMLMPDTDGLATIRKLREINPEMLIVAMTGFRLRSQAPDAGDLLEAAERIGAISTLRKPFLQDELLSAANLVDELQAAEALGLP